MKVRHRRDVYEKRILKAADIAECLGLGLDLWT